MTILLWPSRGVVPIFDGWSFARCALDASWVAVRCEGHPTFGWGVVMAASRLWSIPGATALFLPSLLFGAVALMGVDRLARATLGAFGARLLAGLVVVSCVGGCMASLLTNSRALVPMATDGTFVRALGRVDPASGTPRLAVITTTALGVAYVASRSFEELTDGFVVGYFPFYALAIAALFLLRRREPTLPRPFRAPVVAPITFLAGAALVLGGAMLDGATRMIIPAIVLALGTALSFVFRAPKST